MYQLNYLISYLLFIIVCVNLKLNKNVKNNTENPFEYRGIKKHLFYYCFFFRILELSLVKIDITKINISLIILENKQRNLSL